eukprot:211537_1
MELRQSNSCTQLIPRVTASVETFEPYSFSSISAITLFKDNGYKIVSKIKDTLQGELYKAKHIKSNTFVAIKRTCKSQCKQNICTQNDMTYCVTEDIVKEALILNLLTTKNNPIGDYIVKYVDIFESETDYFLIMEYIPGSANLKDFVHQSHKYIENGKLKMKNYQKTIKYLIWQLSVLLQWLHADMSCCHLDICMENIMLLNCNFTQKSDGYVAINPKIQIKLGDFGVSEIFKANEEKISFKCTKHHLSLDNEEYLAPQIQDNQIYNAKAADIWGLGILIYTCLTGESVLNYNNYSGQMMNLYATGKLKLFDFASNNSVCEWTFSLFWMFSDKDKFKIHLQKNKLMKYFNNNTFSLLIGLLNLKEEKRLNILDVLKHKWFKSYWKQYHTFIEKNIGKENKKILEQYRKLKHFPFYCTKNSN